MAELNIDLHPAQLQIFNSTKRFKIVAAGRRFGKSYLSAWILLIKAIQSDSKDVFYIAPTFQQMYYLWVVWNTICYKKKYEASNNRATLSK